MLTVFIGMVHAYCGNANCAVRDVSVWMKDFDHAEQHRKPMYCPCCRKEMTVNATEDSALYHRKLLENAIGVVNAALYTRQTGESAVPLNILMLEDLPESWEAVRSKF